MAKQIIAVTGEYQKQDGTQGANFAEIGVVMTSQNGKEYALLDPTINLAGILLKQNAMAAEKGEQVRDMVMCSVKERQQLQQGGYSQAPQQPAGNGYAQYQQGSANAQQTAGFHSNQRPAPPPQNQPQGAYQQPKRTAQPQPSNHDYGGFNDDIPM